MAWLPPGKEKACPVMAPEAVPVPTMVAAKLEVVSVPAVAVKPPAGVSSIFFAFSALAAPFPVLFS